MKILSSATGEISLLPTLLPSDKGIILTRYSATTKAGQFTAIYRVTNEVYTCQIAIIAQENDTVTVIHTNPLLCFLISLENSFQCKITGMGEIIQHERWFSFFSLPAFSIECKIKKQNKYSVLLVSFAASWLPNNFVTKNYSAIANRDMLLLIMQSEQTTAASALDASVKELLAVAFNVIHENGGKRSIKVKLQDAQKMYRVREYIDNNIEKKLSLPVIVKGTKTSEYIIKKHFKEVYNETIHDYINDKRMQLAPGLLLNSNNKINDIAHALGFDTTTFNRLFKHYYKVSPTKYRQAK